MSEKGLIYDNFEVDSSVDLKDQLKNLGNPFKTNSIGLFHGKFMHSINTENMIVSPDKILLLVKDENGIFGSSNQNLLKPSGITLSSLKWRDVAGFKKGNHLKLVFCLSLEIEGNGAHHNDNINFDSTKVAKDKNLRTTFRDRDSFIPGTTFDDHADNSVKDEKEQSYHKDYDEDGLMTYDNEQSYFEDDDADDLNKDDTKQKYYEDNRKEGITSDTYAPRKEVENIVNGFKFSQTSKARLINNEKGYEFAKDEPLSTSLPPNPPEKLDESNFKDANTQLFLKNTAIDTSSNLYTSSKKSGAPKSTRDNSSIAREKKQKKQNTNKLSKTEPEEDPKYYSFYLPNSDNSDYYDRQQYLSREEFKKHPFYDMYQKIKYVCSPYGLKDVRTQLSKHIFKRGSYKTNGIEKDVEKITAYDWAQTLIEWMTLHNNKITERGNQTFNLIDASSVLNITPLPQSGPECQDMKLLRGAVINEAERFNVPQSKTDFDEDREMKIFMGGIFMHINHCDDSEYWNT
eukprot:CAMPEP_0119039678 /NCGR_PEP_ID=MMETSP1177-20130426/9295_1 /TAXON_ID=2985 /ORGANISM="Ochromonas sp, Strain CCMP1899" /LENGTH=514 /DNA_ID=CAMNT_0007003861 /DNA_START=924 /DNA_END=2468 /DNA_ORIENTATION=+